LKHIRKEQVDKPKQEVLPTSSYLWEVTVHPSDTWWTAVL